MINDDWEPVVGYEGIYEVNRHGQVRSIDRVCVGRDGHRHAVVGKTLTVHRRRRMPSAVRLRRDGNDEFVAVCEMVANAFVPNPQGLSNVIHIDGDMHNDDASNLAWSAAAEWVHMKDWGGLAHKEHRLYNVWMCMILRCEDKSRHFYERYGGRGISVCTEWHDFKEFVAWSYANGYEDGLSIDRIDNDGNYCPQNCRWVPWEQQSLNTSKNVLIEIGGKSQTAAEWAEETGISRFTIYYWVREHGKDYAAERIVESVKSGSTKRVYEKTCQRCGVHFTSMQDSAKYCASCKPIVNIEYGRQWRARKKAEGCGAYFGEEES